MPLGHKSIHGLPLGEIGKPKMMDIKPVEGWTERFFARYRVSSSNLVLWLDQGDQQAGTDTDTWDDLSGREISGQDNDMVQDTASYQPTVTGAFPGYRDFDGNDNFMQQEEADDESGATFWPTNAGAAFNAGNARFRVAGVDLSTFASATNDYMLVVHDSADKTAFGYIDVADVAEALGAEINTQLNATSPSNETDATTGFTNVGFNIFASDTKGDEPVGSHSLHITAGDAGDRCYTSFTTVIGKLYFLDMYYITTNGDVDTRIQLRVGVAENGQENLAAIQLFATSWTQIQRYFVASATTTYVTFPEAANANNIDAYIDTLSLKEVTKVGTDGVLIMSTKGGSTQSWALQESGIDLNDIDSFEVLKTDFQITTALSVFMWIKPDDGQPGGERMWLSKWRTTDKFRSFACVAYDTGDIRMYLSDDGISITKEETNVAFFANGQETWHHIGVVYNGTTVVIYGDGVALASTTTGGIPASLHDTPEKLTIGALSTPDSYFAGLIGPTHLFERALTADEVLRLYQADYARFI